MAWVRAWVPDHAPTNYDEQGYAVSALINSQVLSPELTARLREVSHTITALRTAKADR